VHTCLFCFAFLYFVLYTLDYT